MTSLSEIKKRLDSNPIYALSLGSRELFHSNFLEWLLKNYPPMIAALVEGPIPEQEKIIKRERDNFDLVISFGDKDALQSFVIEIKVKDAPRLDQIERYDKKLKDKISRYGENPQKILLSLVEPPVVLKWRCLGFYELGKNILSLMPAIEINSEHTVIIRQYAQLCCDLEALIRKVTVVDLQARQYFFPKTGKEDMFNDVDHVLKELRFQDTVEKQRASALCEEIRHQAKNVVWIGPKPSFANGFDRKMPHVGATLAIKLEDASNSEIQLSIHIQGQQYRRLLSFNQYLVASRTQGKNTDSIQSFIEETDGWNWMFGATHDDGYFESSNMQGGFFMDMTQIPTRQQKNKILCSYAPKYIYQYTNIGDEFAVPVDRLVEAVIADLQYASELLTNPEYVGRFSKWKMRQG